MDSEGQIIDIDNPSDIDEATRKRPLGVSILAVLEVISAISLVAMQVAWGDTLSTVSVETTGSAFAGYYSMAVYAISGMIAGVGMWLGKRWGWWAGTFGLMLGVLRNAKTLLAIPGIVQQYGLTLDESLSAYFKYGSRVVVQPLWFLYYFKGNVLGYFGLKDLSKAKTMALLVFGVLLVFVLGTIIQLVT